MGRVNVPFFFVFLYLVGFISFDSGHSQSSVLVSHQSVIQSVLSSSISKRNLIGRFSVNQTPSWFVIRSLHTHTHTHTQRTRVRISNPVPNNVSGLLYQQIIF